jgi:hypothetical protein
MNATDLASNVLCNESFINSTFVLNNLLSTFGQLMLSISTFGQLMLVKVFSATIVVTLE